jgi:flagellar biosynthesis/type III secretory pathway protein FliH
MPLLRGVSVGPDAYFIGESDPVVEKPSWHRPPPPPPPAVPLAEPEYPDPSAAWASPGWNESEEDREPVDHGPHPLEEVVQEKLAEAERLLADAMAEADNVIAQASRQAAELAEEAAAELERAREEAEHLRIAAEADVQRIRDEAEAAGHLAGYDAGHAEGLAKAEESVADKIGHVTRLAISAAVDRRELLHNAEAEVVRLATRIAGKVIQRELATDPSIVHRMAEAALRHVAADGLIRLRVNPQDHLELRDYWTRAHGMAEADRTYEIVADPAIQRGGIVIETRAGSVDAQIETQLAEIAGALGVEEPEAPPEPAAEPIVQAPPEPLVVPYAG